MSSKNFCWSVNQLQRVQRLPYQEVEHNGNQAVLKLPEQGRPSAFIAQGAVGLQYLSVVPITCIIRSG
jgi:hypothetical protein